MEALDEDRKHASDALVYIGDLYNIEKEMREAGLEPDAIKERRQKESYPIIQKFEKWMDSAAGLFSSKSRMGRAIVYSLFASCKAAGVDTREWLEDTLKRLPSEDTTALLPGKWQKNDRN